MSDESDPFAGEEMKPASGGSRIGLLEVACYVAAIVVVIGSAVRGWSGSLFIALIILVVLYAVLRDVRALTRLESRKKPPHDSETVIPLQRPSSGRRNPHPSYQMSGGLGELKKAQDFSEWARAGQQTIGKGTTHESNEFRKA